MALTFCVSTEILAQSLNVKVFNVLAIFVKHYREREGVLALFSKDGRI